MDKFNQNILVGLYNTIVNNYDFIELAERNLNNAESEQRKEEYRQQIEEYKNEIYYLRKFINMLHKEGYIGKDGDNE